MFCPHQSAIGARGRVLPRGSAFAVEIVDKDSPLRAKRRHNVPGGKIVPAGPAEIGIEATPRLQPELFDASATTPKLMTLHQLPAPGDFQYIDQRSAAISSHRVAFEK